MNVADARRRLRASIDFSELVSDYTDLTWAGSRGMTGLCPFHDELSPSFNIEPIAKLYYCFGCGAGGDYLKFVREIEDLDVIGAIRFLGRRFEIDLGMIDRVQPSDLSAERSLIGDLLKRVPGHAGRWPHEDLLTKATAAVLRRVPGLAAHAFRVLADSTSEPSEPVDVETQVRIDGGIVDLELRSADGLTVWVEVKLDAGQSGPQLDTYVSQHPNAPGGAMVYLSRLGSSRAERSDVRDVRWQTFGEHLAAWLERQGSGLKQEEAWLLNDYLRYLSERNLTMSDPLNAQTLERVALDYQTSLDRLTRIHRMVNERVTQERWVCKGLQDGTRRADWPFAWWAVYASEPPDAYPGCDFQVAIEGLNGVQEPRVCAGLISRSGDSALLQDVWNAMRQLYPGDGFDTFQDPRTHGGDRLYRSIGFEQLDAASTLGDQADLIARLALLTFGLLRDRAGSPPPTSDGS